VKKVKPGEIIVTDIDKGNDFRIIGNELITQLLSADEFHTEEKVPLTRLAEILSTSFSTPFTVCFDKQDGEERILRGRLLSPEPLLGRSHVEDLDIKDKHKLRLVDHRNLKWIVVNGVKYTRK